MARRVVIRALKICAAAYLALFLLVAAHFPRTIGEAARNWRPGALLAPILAPQILRSYGQVFMQGAWPWGARPDSAPLDYLLDAYGVAGDDPTQSVLALDTTPPGIAPGQEGHSSLAIRREDYASQFAGAALDSHVGFVTRIGRYTCLGPSEYSTLNLLVGPPNCYAIQPLAGGGFRLTNLRQSRTFEARLAASRPQR